MNNAIFLDRDGTIIEYPLNENYIDNKLCNMKFIPDTAKAIKLLNSLDYKIIVITNQSTVAYGNSTEEDLNIFNRVMIKELEKFGARIDKVYYCPHCYSDNCDCRKPKNKLMKLAAKEFDIDLSNSWMIGDTKTDMQTGKNVGCKTILVKTGYGKIELEKYGCDIEHDYVVHDLAEAARTIYSQQIEKV